MAKAANYCVERAATMNGFSSRQFYRVFRQEMSCSPKKWFKQQQLELARKLLIRTGSVKIAAYECGFSQVPNFCRDFKKHFGVSASRVIRLSGP